MADERVVTAVKIVDPTTTSQEAGVDSSGFLQVDIAASSVTVTADTELAAAAALADAASATPTTPTVGAVGLVMNATTLDRQRAVIAALDSVGTGIAAAGMVGQFDDASVAAVTENQFAPVRISTRRALLVEGVASGTNINVNLAASAATVTVDSELPAAAALTDDFANPTAPGVGSFLMEWDGSAWDRGPGTAADGLLVNLGTNNDVSITGAVDTELPAAAALADAVANPTVPAVGAYAVGFNGTTWDRIRTANTGRLQVDVVTGGGSNTPTNPTVNAASSTDTAAGASANLDSAEITEAEKLWQVIIGASVAFKAILQKVQDGSATAIATFFGRAGTSIIWTPIHPNFAAHAGAAAGVDVFRVVATNLDTSQAANLYADYFYAT